MQLVSYLAVSTYVQVLYWPERAVAYKLHFTRACGEKEKTARLWRALYN